MTALDQYANEASELAAEAQSNGTGNHRAHYAVGVLAILAGATAAGLGFGDVDPILTGIGGIAATMLAGIQTLFQFEPKAQYHREPNLRANPGSRRQTYGRRLLSDARDESKKLRSHSIVLRERALSSKLMPRPASRPAAERYLDR